MVVDTTKGSYKKKIYIDPYNPSGSGGVNRLIRDIISISNNTYFYSNKELISQCDIVHGWGLSTLDKFDVFSVVGRYYEEDCNGYGDGLDSMPWCLMETWNQMILENCSKARIIHIDALSLKLWLEKNGFASILIPNAINPDIWKRNSDKIFDKRISFYGSGRYVKRPNVILEIASNMPDYEFFMIGPGTDRAILEIKYGKVPSNVNCLGYCDTAKTISILQSSFVILFPAINDASSGAIREAMGLESLVIASDSLSHKEVITDGVNGFLVLGEKPEEFVNKIREVEGLLDLNEIRTQARKTILERFSIENFVEKMNELYVNI